MYIWGHHGRDHMVVGFTTIYIYSHNPKYNGIEKYTYYIYIKKTLQNVRQSRFVIQCTHLQSG